MCICVHEKKSGTGLCLDDVCAVFRGYGKYRNTSYSYRLPGTTVLYIINSGKHTVHINFFSLSHGFSPGRLHGSQYPGAFCCNTV